VTLKLPVNTTEPVTNIDPLNSSVSELAKNIVSPVFPTKLVDPVTVKDPEITTDWFN
jgi:hypothetical protein